ncbi:MAG: hypothetical protein JNK48_17645 [Bryobacterales bacterium]|nr:hypothetical protein [Bryobacterales bacterium]
MKLRICALFCLLASALFAKQDLTGVWSMVAEKSDFGAMPVPSKIERTIAHKDPSILIKTVQAGQQGEITTEYKYTTDGQEFSQTTRFGEVKGTAVWEGDNLVVKTKRQVQGAEITSTETWSLAEGGKALTVSAQVTTPQGEFKYKIHFEKK